jgi:hypothetical protein
LYFDPDKSRARINFKGIAKYVLTAIVSSQTHWCPRE